MLLDAVDRSPLPATLLGLALRCSSPMVLSYERMVERVAADWQYLRIPGMRSRLLTMATGWQIPDGSLRTSVIGTNAVGLGAVVLLAWAVRSPLHLSDDYALRASGLFALIMLLALGHVRAGHPFTRFGPANQLTAARATIVSLVAALIGESITPVAATAAAGVSIAAAALDGVDGALARRTGMASTFGARFDMETDALLIMVLSVLAWQLGKAGAWIVLSGLLRYAFVALGWALPFMRRPLPPSRRRQAVCVVQVVGLSLAILPALVPPPSAALAAGLLATLGGSFALDTLWLWRHRD